MLGDAEKFFAIIQMPYLKQRLEAFLYKVSFDHRVKEIQSKLGLIQQAIGQVTSSNHLIRLLEV